MDPINNNPAVLIGMVGLICDCLSRVAAVCGRGQDDYEYRDEVGVERESMLEVEMVECNESATTAASIVVAIDDGGDAKWNPFATPSDLSMALDLACSAGDDRQLLHLLEAGVHPDLVNEGEGDPALHRASGEGNEKIVALLLSHRASPNAHACETGDSPLHAVAAACCSSLKSSKRQFSCVQTQIAETLLQARADVNARNFDESTPLHMACRKGHEHMVALLLSHKADICSRTSDGFTALHRACYAQSLPTTRTLLKFASTNAILELIVNASETEHADQDSSTPLHFAVRGAAAAEKAAAVIKGRATARVGLRSLGLITKGDITSISEKDAGEEEEEIEVVRVCELLLMYGASLEKRDHAGLTPLALSQQTAVHGDAPNLAATKRRVLRRVFSDWPRRHARWYKRGWLILLHQRVCDTVHIQNQCNHIEKKEQAEPAKHMQQWAIWVAGVQQRAMKVDAQASSEANRSSSRSSGGNDGDEEDDEEWEWHESPLPQPLLLPAVEGTLVFLKLTYPLQRIVLSWI